MRLICVLVIFVLFLAIPAMGGEIWGMVRKDGVPQEGLWVKILFHDGQPHESEPCKTDQFGLYSIFLDWRGQCELKVFDKSTEIYSATVASYKAPVRWNVHLIAAPEK
jgi:hypothetical protein